MAESYGLIYSKAMGRYLVSNCLFSNDRFCGKAVVQKSYIKDVFGRQVAIQSPRISVIFVSQERQLWD